jgi:hypothetical protein
MKMKLWPALAIMSLSLAAPVSAQESDRDIPYAGLARNTAECHAQFQRADLDGDGVLDRVETSEARGLIPTSLSGDDEISRQTFLSACQDFVKQQSQGEGG